MSFSNITVSKSIAFLRQNAGMTQLQLASVLDVSHQAVSKWETGLALPDFATMLNISKLFGVTIEQLICGDIPGMEQPDQSDTIEKICDFAGVAAKAAQQIGATVIDGVSKAFNSAGEFVSGIYTGANSGKNDETQSFEADEAETGSVENAEFMSFASLIDLAPFMSKEKLTEEVLKCTEVPTADKLCALGPFISSDALEKLIKRFPGEVNADILVKLAPFLKKEQLFTLILQCPDALTFQNLKRFAPWLKRGMVDSIVEAINKAKTVVDTAELRKQANDVTETLREKICDAVNNVISDDTEEAAADTEQVTADTSREHTVISTELKDKVARAALDAKSWLWLNSHINEIGDEAVIYDIAAAALDETECEELFIKAVSLLGPENISRLVSILIDSRNYDKLRMISGYTETRDADSILIAACSDCAENETALDCVRKYSVLASADVISSLTNKAISDNNWLLIETLTPAM